jgi:alkylated DNA repair dioxygenase AlkB
MKVVEFSPTTPTILGDPNLPGFIYVRNAIAKETADMITRILDSEVEGKSQWRGVTVKRDSRQVIHYGYEYKYDRSGLGPASPIPAELAELMRDLQCKYNIPPTAFNQLIVNKYSPGEGISPHVDHVKYFGPMIVCLTLGSGCEVEFTRDGHMSIHKYVEPLSMYIMALDARFEWKHAIVARKSDVVDGHEVARGTRISLTWRTVR